MLDAYREHVAGRAQQNIPPKPLSAEQVAALVELLKAPPAGEEQALLELISTRVPPGVDEAARLDSYLLSPKVRANALSSTRRLRSSCWAICMAAIILRRSLG